MTSPATTMDFGTDTHWKGEELSLDPPQQGRWGGEAARPFRQTERPRAPACDQVAESQLAAIPAEKQVVDLAAQHTVAVDQLPVEDVQAEQHSVHQPFPAPVITSSGIAPTAVATMTTR